MQGTPLYPLLKDQLPARAWNILNFAEIETVEQLIALTPRELRKYRNCGYKTVADIRLALRQHGFDLKEPGEFIHDLKEKIRKQDLVIERLRAEIVRLQVDL